jgi:hypothetical protein
MVRGRGKTSVRGGRRKDDVLMGGGMDGGRSVRFEGKPGAELLAGNVWPKREICATV